jgi:hypothetical protein
MQPVGVGAALFVVFGIAAAVAVTHMNNLPAFIVIAPGYLVQAWLFERHHAPGGLGYEVTMVGVSALVWTLLVLGLVFGLVLMSRLLRRLVPRGGTGDASPDA